MVIRLLVAMSGRDQAWTTGDLYECDDAAAARMVAAGLAEYLAPPRAPETAMASGAVERAVKPRGRARG